MHFLFVISLDLQQTFLLLEIIRMSQDVTVNPIIITFDVVQNAIDFGAFSDYLKTNYKKEVVFLNPQDFSDNKSAAKGKNTTGTIVNNAIPWDKKNLVLDPQSISIAKGIKTKIDADLIKVLEAKRKTYASYEKEKLKAASKSSKSSNADKSTSGANSNSGQTKPKTNVDFEELKLSLPFEGRIDIVYILLNYPYLPRHLAALNDAGVDITAFLAVVPKTFDNNNTDTSLKENEENTRISTTEKKQSTTPLDKSARQLNPSQSAKKSIIQNHDIIPGNNPNAFPPVRWNYLHETAPFNIIFDKIYAGDSIEATFKNLEEKLILYSKSKESSTPFFKTKTIIDIPLVPSVSKISSNSRSPFSLTDFEEYITERPGEFVNAIYYELKCHNYAPVQPPPTPPITDQYNNLFRNAFSNLERHVIFIKPKELNDIQNTEFTVDYPETIYSLIYKLIKWSLKKEDINACMALSLFLGKPSNFYVYAGSKFDTIVQTTNKKYSLGMPLSYFDWSQWNYMSEHLLLDDSIIEGIQNAEIIETIFDQAIGILWVLALHPVPKITGQFQSNYSMPQTIDGVTEYINKLYKTDMVTDGQPERKSRNPPTPAQLIRDGADLNVLLPSLIQRMNNSDTYYKLPMEVANSMSFNSPYYFESGLKINIIREMINGKMSFNYKANYKDFFEIFANPLAITIQTFEGIRMKFERPFTVTMLFNEQSIRFDAETFSIKNLGECPITVTRTGAYIMNDKDSLPLIIQPNGSVTRRITPEQASKSLGIEIEDSNKPIWRTIDKDGNSLIQLPSGEYCKENLRIDEVVDLTTMTKTTIRPDQIEYYTRKDGSRRILYNEYIIEQVESADNSDSNAPLNKKISHGPLLFHIPTLDEIEKLSSRADPESNRKFIYDVPRFPLIEMHNEEITIPLDRFLFRFGDKYAKMACPNYSINITEDGVYISAPPSSEENHDLQESNPLSMSISRIDDDDQFDANQTLMRLIQNRCEFRYNDKVLVADDQGLEKVCQLLPDNSLNDTTSLAAKKKKKNDTSIDTYWGKAQPLKDTITEQQQIDTYKKFNAHFYAIRSDMTICEFIRKDTINEDDFTVYQESLSHPTGNECEIISYHNQVQPPQIYLLNQPLTKAERSTIMKGLHIPKPKKEKPKSLPKSNEQNTREGQNESDNLGSESSSKSHKHGSRKSKSKDTSETCENDSSDGHHKSRHHHKTDKTSGQELETDNQENTKRIRSKSRAQATNDLFGVETESSIRLASCLSNFKDDNNDPEGDEALSNADANRLAFLCDNKLFVQAMNEKLQKHEMLYQEKMRPPSPPPIEILQIPPITPSPRLLEAQANKYAQQVLLHDEPNLQDDELNSNINYWNSHEADFAMPLEEPKMLPKDLSPRAQLFDPPRKIHKKKLLYDKMIKNPSDSSGDSEDDKFDESYTPIGDPIQQPPEPLQFNNSLLNNSIMKKRTKKIIYNNKSVNIYTNPMSNSKSILSTNRNKGTASSNGSFSIRQLGTSSSNTSGVSTSKRDVNSTTERPVTVKATPNIINFGQVKANTPATAQIVVTNTGKVPLHYSATQTSNPSIQVLTIPGVVFPGLKMILKVALLPIEEPQSITTSFQLKTQMFDLSIPVTVKIIE